MTANNAADAAAMTTARPEDVISGFMHDLAAEQGNRIHGWGRGTSRQLLSALTDAGYVIVERDDLELAVEWMDQSDNPWSGEAFQETWVDSLLMRDRLKDALAESYAARQGEETDGR